MQNSEQRRNRQLVPLCLSVTLGLLILWVTMLGVVRASEPVAGSAQENGPIIGLASNALECLAVGGDVPGTASGVVRLAWDGQVERARLIMSISGAEAAHTIRLNGRPVASTPIQPGGQPCRNGDYFYLDIPPEALVQGDNQIEITNDALDSDSWTAADVRLEVLGRLAVPRAVAPGGAGPTGSADVFPNAALTMTVPFTNPYDGSSQEARVLGYDGSTPPLPLVIYIHGRASSMYEGEKALGAAVRDKGWLLASPELHGSWTGVPEPNPPGAYAYASLESQYDIIGITSYMLDHYNVVTDQIYLVGYSMGGQIAAVTAAKFPHVFAAVFDNKGPTNMAEWYDEQWEKTWMRRECHVGGDPKAPAENPFCYQRRSGDNFASNYIHIPISITHSVSDTLVPIHHSRDLRDAINSYGPDQRVYVLEDTVIGPTCDDGGRYHCYAPDPMDVLSFLEQFTLNSVPLSVNVTTDESKDYYWLNLTQAGGDHWSRVHATCYPLSTTVVATISDTQPLTVGFNLGSASTIGVIEQPGMGLPATTYLIRGGGNCGLQDYASGYLTATLAATGQFTLTISAVTADVAAHPAMVLGVETTSSTIVATLEDHLGNPVPDGTVVRFDTSEGTFPNASAMYTAATTGGMVTGTLTLQPAADLADIVISFGSIAASASVDVIHPALELLVTPSQMAVDSGQTVTYTYRLTNTGDITLTAVTLVDDNGTPEDGVDDLTAWTDITLAAGEEKSEARVVTLTQTTTNTVVVTGRHPLGQETARYSTTVVVRPPCVKVYLPVVRRDG